MDNEQRMQQVATKAKDQKPKMYLTGLRCFPNANWYNHWIMIPVIGLLAAGGMLNGFLTLLSDPNFLV